MGNEQSQNKELTQNGKVPEKHENGSVNGLSANITSNGVEIDVKPDTAVHQNGEPLSLNLTTDSIDLVTVEADCPPAIAQVISDIPDIPVVQKEEVKKSKEEKVKLFGKLFKKKAEPAAEVETVAGNEAEQEEASSEDQTDVSLPPADPHQDSSGEAAAVITEHQEGRPRQNADTQTSDDDTTTDPEVVTMEAATDEDLLDEFIIIDAEDIVKDTWDSGINTEDMVIMENIKYKSVVFRKGKVVDNYGLEVADTKKCCTEDDTAAEDNKTEPLEVTFSLPKVVADCIKAVFADSETTDDAAVIPSEPGVDEVITEDNSEGAGDMSADVRLIESTEPEPNAVTPEAGQANGIPSLDGELAAETISVLVHEESNPTPATQDKPAEGPAVPVHTEILVKMASGHEEVTAEDAPAVRDVPEIHKREELGPVSADEPSGDCDGCPEELPEDTLDSEVKPVLEVGRTDEKAEVGTAAESEPGFVIINNNAEEIPEAMIDFLSQQFEPRASTPQEPATDLGSPVEEEVIVATVFVPLSVEQETSLSLPEEPVGSVMNEDAIEALSNVLEDIVVQEWSTEGRVTEVASAEESEKNGAVGGALVDAESSQTPEQIPKTSEEPAEENPSGYEEDAVTELLKKVLQSVLKALSVKLEAANGPPMHAAKSEQHAKAKFLPVIHETAEDEVTERVTGESAHPAVEENYEGAATDEDLEALVEEILREEEEEEAECNPSEDKERDENEASASALDSERAEGHSVSSSDVKGLLVQETANLKPEEAELTVPESESVTPDVGPEEEKVPDSDDQPEESREESNPDENSVMNFFKTLVTTKTSKKETATPDAAKDQSQKETQPAATTTVAQISEPPAAPKGMSIPPPPPPEPPKLEMKGEPAKPVKPTPKEEPKAAAKAPESSKGKAAKDAFSKFFRPKVLLGVKTSKGKGASASGVKTAAGTIKDAPQPAVDVEVQPVVEVQETPAEVPEPVVEVQTDSKVDLLEAAVEMVQAVVEEQMEEAVPQPVVEAEKKVDPSKAGTLEAAAKPEPPPPVQEEKKTSSKPAFFSLFKPKAAEPKKVTPTPPAAAEGAQVAKAKEEPKAAAAAKTSEAVVDNKPASVTSQAGDDAANVPRKLEKRNSIQLFFKNLMAAATYQAAKGAGPKSEQAQKRHSTDAGVQTEPVVVAPAAEKAK